MKRGIKWAVVGLGLAAINGAAETIIFKGMAGDPPTTGELLTGTRDIARTTNVVEVAGLQITARSGSSRHEINATVSDASLGIDDKDRTQGEGDATARLDNSEKIILSFNRRVEITGLDLIGFNSNSVFVVAIDGQVPLEIGYGDLTNRSSQIYQTKLVVEAETEIQFYVANTNSVIGLQSIDVTVLDATGLPSLSMAGSNGTAFISVVFDGEAGTTYALQQSSNLASNDWTTLPGAFLSDTNLTVVATNDCAYFRVVEVAP